MFRALKTSLPSALQILEEGHLSEPGLLVCGGSELDSSRRKEYSLLTEPCPQPLKEKPS